MISHALAKRKMKNMSLTEQVDKAVQYSIGHIMEENCVCVIERLIDGPEGEMNTAFRLFFNHITPFEITSETTKIDTTRFAKSPDEATNNLKEFASKYDGKFSNWIAANGKTPDMMLEDSFKA